MSSFDKMEAVYALSRLRTMIAFLLVFCAVTLSFSTPISNDITSTDSIDVLVGGSVAFHCVGKVNKWIHISKTEETVVVYSDNTKKYTCAGSFVKTGSECRDTIIVDSNDGHSMIINSVKMEDAGIYACVNSDAQTKQTTVTVINKLSLKLGIQNSLGATLPLIEYGRAVFPNDIISISCSLNFSGFVPPTMDLTLGGDPDIIDMIPALPLAINPAGKFYQNAYILARTQVSKDDFNSDLPVSCGDSGAIYGASNDILKLIRDPTFDDPQELVMLKLTSNGAELDCTADSYPEAIYAWRYIDYDMVRIVDESGPSLTATATGVFYCDATNIMTKARISKQFKVISSTSDYSGFGGTTSMAVTIALITITVGALIGVLIGVLVWTRWRKPGRTAENANAYCNAQPVYFSNAPPSYYEVVGGVPGAAFDPNKPPDAAQPSSSQPSESLPSYIEATTPKDVSQEHPFQLPTEQLPTAHEPPTQQSTSQEPAPQQPASQEPPSQQPVSQGSAKPSE